MDIRQAIADLNNPDWILQNQALSLLSAARAKEAVPALRNLAASAPTPYSRGRALVALAEILKGEMAAEVLNQANASDPTVRAAAVEALGVLGDARGESVALARIKDPAPIVRQSALVAYARLKKGAAYALVAAQLKAADAPTLRAAAAALVYVPTPEARKRLLELLEHSLPPVRIAAAAALAAIQEPSAVRPLLVHTAGDADPDVRTACEQLLRNFPGKLIQGPAMGVLNATEPALYIPAVNALALNPTPEVCDQLAAVLASANDAYEPALPAALRCLYSLDAPRYLPTFRKFLSHKSADVRGQAIEGVLRCPKADHFELLQAQVSDPNPYLANTTMNALAKVTAGAPPGGMVKYLAKNLQRDDSLVARTALNLMRGRLKPEEFNPALEAMAKLLSSGDEGTRQAAAGVLERVAPDDESKARIASAQGFVTQWMLIGPFPADKPPLQTVWPPEDSVDYKKRYDILLYAAGAKEVDIGGRKILLYTPVQDECKGKLSAAFGLEVPAGSPKFSAQVALRDNPGGEGAVLTVLLNGQPLLEKKIVKVEPEAIEADLSAAAGQAANLEFVLACGRGAPYSPVLMTSAVVAGDKTVNLLDLLPKAVVKIIDAKPAVDVGWVPCPIANITGGLSIEGALRNIGGPAAVAYASAEINIPQGQKVTLVFRSSNTGSVFVNGKKVGDPAPHRDNKLPAQLTKGLNRILVKSVNDYPYWWFCLRIVTPEGQLVPFTPVAPTEKP